MPVPQAAALLMPVLLVMDVHALHVLRRDADWKVAKFLIAFGLVGTVVGTLLFKFLDARMVAGVVGACTLLFLAQRVLWPPAADRALPSRVTGVLLSTEGGFSSFIANAGGPAVTAYLLPMRLAPAAFAGTMAVFFFAINLAKWAPYAWLGLFDARRSPAP